MAELELSVCLRRPAMMEVIHVWAGQRNAAVAQLDWPFTTADGAPYRTASTRRKRIDSARAHFSDALS